MPLQLLNLGVIVPRLFYLFFLTRTPRGMFLPCMLYKVDADNGGRLRGIERASNDQLWGCLPASNTYVCDHPALQCGLSPHRRLRLDLFWYGLCRL
jgi:hypothetical protein